MRERRWRIFSASCQGTAKVRGSIILLIESCSSSISKEMSCSGFARSFKEAAHSFRQFSLVSPSIHNIAAEPSTSLTVTSPNRRGYLFKVRSRNTSISRIAENALFVIESNRLPIYTGRPIGYCLFSVKVCHARVFSRVGRVTGVTARHMAGNLMGRG